jgi:hypothetical protein
MELQDLEELMRDLLQAIQLMVDSGEEMSDELQGAVAQTLEMLYSRIEQLRGEAPPEPPEEPPDLQPSMPSSNIEGFAYNDKTGQLYVRFRGKHPDRNGPVYQYNNVPQNIYDIFQKGAIPAKTDGKNKWGKWWKGKYPSMGAAMYHLIRAGGFPYQRVG